MSKQSLSDFRTRLLNDENLRSEMQTTLGRPDPESDRFASDLVAFARTKGFEFDVSELRETPELSDDELETVAGGASDYLLEIDGIKLESTFGRQKHKDWIDILSFSYYRG